MTTINGNGSVRTATRCSCVANRKIGPIVIGSISINLDAINIHHGSFVSTCGSNSAQGVGAWQILTAIKSLTCCNIKNKAFAANNVIAKAHGLIYIDISQAILVCR